MSEPVSAVYTTSSSPARWAYQNSGTSQTTATSNLSDLGFREATAAPPSSQLDKEAFLKLLVAQLRYQDPLNPNDPAEFMSTTAQFTTIEKLDELTKQGSNAAVISGLSMAGNLVGRSITYLDGDNVRQTAVVASAEVIAGQVTLATDRGPVTMTSVMGIGAMNPPAPATT